ncbi:MAG: hypothetical protein H7Y17_00530, partial [Chlorobia bacterium]|nr:hypothetical protein [Fimbriimonadaceae bacterium]
TSDGNKFSYQIENSSYHRAPGLRLTEPVANPRVGVTHTLASIYAASSKSIGDRSTPLDIAISAPGDLVYRAGQWGKGYGKEGKKEINGKSAFLVGGEFRPYAGAEATGRYHMAITEGGELLEYIEVIKVAVGDGPNPQIVEVTSRWDVNLIINGKVDPSLFRVVSR